LRDVARAVPLDRLLTETDSPFLAPVPYRGKRNEPAYVARIVALLADLHQISGPEMALRTAANFHSLFRP
jgi:TatD DNase family protein